ncbi:MAG: hypothetical protein JNM25_08600 [Planctomycetes bacterium]|nr:hypothetical protein [Planctomycetota bacterium]
MRATVPITFSALVCTLVSSGCSGSNDGGASTLLPTPGVEITQANAQDLALRTLRSAFGFVDAAEVGSNLAFAAPPLPSQVALATVAAALASGSPASAVLLPASVSSTAEGPEGGQVLRAWEDQDGDGRLSPGDSILSVLTAYGDRGRSFSGIVMLDVFAVTGVPPLVGVTSGRLSLVNLTVTSDAGTAAFAGSMQFRRETRLTVELFEMVLDADLEVDEATLQAGTRIAFNRYPQTETFAMFADGSLLVDGSPGAVVFATSVPFSGLSFLPDPYAGELVLSGGQRRTITARVMSLTTLRIQADLDGDGKVDETAMSTWPL